MSISSSTSCQSDFSSSSWYEAEYSLPMFIVPIKEPAINYPTKICFINNKEAVKEILTKQYKKEKLPRNQNILLQEMLHMSNKLKELLKCSDIITQCDIKMLLELIEIIIKFRPTDMNRDDIEYIANVYEIVSTYYPDIISIEPYQINGAINSLSIFGPLKKEVWAKK